MISVAELNAEQLAELYATIGKSIVHGIPYRGMKLGVEARTGINPAQADEPELYPVPERFGPARDNVQVTNELTDKRLYEIVEAPSTCDWWYYDRVPRRIIKSMAIPYTWRYTDEDTGQTVDKADFILVGYVGWEPPG